MFVPCAGFLKIHLNKGRMIEDINQDTGITLVTLTKVSSQEDRPEYQLGVLSAAKVLADAAKEKVNTYTRRRRAVSTGSEGVSTAYRIVSTADVVKEGVKDKAYIQANEELAQKMLEEERESLSITERAKLLAEIIDKRKKLQAAQRYEAIRNKPQTMSQQRKDMCTYMKNMAGYKMEHFKGKSFYEVNEIFDKVYKQVTSFVPMESDMEKERTKRVRLNLQEESSKRQKTKEGSESTKEPKADEISQEDLKQIMLIVPVEEVYVEALQVKYPIIDWEVYIEDSRKYWKIIRERFSTIKPTYDKEKVLWFELKRLFKPNNDDILWKLQRYMHDPLAIEGKVHSNNLATLTRQARLSPSLTGNTLEMILTVEVVLTNGTLLLAEIVLEAGVAPKTSKNRMFDELPLESIDGYMDLKAAFLAYFMQQKKYVNDPIEIHNIKQKDGETIEEFIEGFKIETGRMKGAPECMRISGFMHGKQKLVDMPYTAYTWTKAPRWRLPSPYNSIIGRPEIREIQALPSTDHGMLKFPVKGGIVTICSIILTPTECITIAATPKDHAKKG
nr:reverse transcriptase domain-containing protein [Tanacetum cinerariifolium]